jgi:hypothetical protein
MRRAVLALVTLLLVTTIAHAEPPGLTIATPLTATPWSTIQSVDTGISTVAPPTTETRSYRGQLVAADSAALMAGIVAGGSGIELDDELRGIGVGTFLLAAPMIHAANGHGLRALGSLGLRLALPTLGAALGVHLQTRSSSQCTLGGLCHDAVPQGGLVIGIGIGALTAVVVDTWLLAKPTKVTRSGWAPTASPTRGGATVGLTGRF